MNMLIGTSMPGERPATQTLSTYASTWQSRLRVGHTSRRALPRCLLALVLGPTGFMLLIDSSSDASAATPVWAISAAFTSTSVISLGGISCASKIVCEAVGEGAASGSATVFGTKNGGTTWTAQTVPGGVLGAGLTGISCASKTVCEAVGGGSIFGTTNGGATWTTQTLPAGVFSISAISCASTTTCEAVEGYTNGIGPAVVLGTVNGGATWTTQTVPLGVGVLYGIACVSATICDAVGNSTSSSAGVAGVIINTTTAGSNWVSQTVPTGVVQLEAISCVSATTCGR